jgi:beta-glucosidase-like glycosyl hydrolase
MGAKNTHKIPLLYGIDAVHGHKHVDEAVIFPHNIGLGATRNPRLVESAARATAQHPLDLRTRLLSDRGMGRQWEPNSARK